MIPSRRLWRTGASCPQRRMERHASSRCRLRIAGRVVTKLPGVDVTGLKAFFQDSHLPGRYTPGKNFDGTVLTDADGRFTIDGLRRRAGKRHHRRWN